eukprot:SAG31_NODE_2672_length_5268_cov_41.402273_4_plen_98_part_00
MLAPANDAAIAKPAIANLFDAPSLDSIDVDAIIQEYGAGGPSFGGFGLAEALHIVNVSILSFCTVAKESVFGAQACSHIVRIQYHTRTVLVLCSTLY